MWSETTTQNKKYRRYEKVLCNSSTKRSNGNPKMCFSKRVTPVETCQIHLKWHTCTIQEQKKNRIQKSYEM